MRFARAARHVARDQPIGVTVVGCGYWGRNYVRVFSELADARVVSVCDTSLDRLNTVGAAFPNVDLVTSLDVALAHPEVHAAIICTPASTHAALTRRCLAAGVHTLVEKPMTTSGLEAANLIKWAELRGTTLMAGHTFVFNSGIRKLKEYVVSGDLGDVYYLYSRRTSLGPIRMDVNALWDLAPHDISIFNHLLDSSPSRVSAVGAKLLSEDREDVGFVTLTYPGPVIAHVHVSWADPNKTRELVLVGSEKRVVFNDLDPLERVRVFDKGVRRVPPEAETFGEFAFLLRDGDILSPMVEPTEPLKNECQHFAGCVRSGTRPLTDGLAGRDVVVTMEAIDRSLALNGAPVPVSLEEEVSGAGRWDSEAPSSVR